MIGLNFPCILEIYMNIITTLFVPDGINFAGDYNSTRVGVVCRVFVPTYF